MGTVGPKRVTFTDDGAAPPPPVRLVDNLESLTDDGSRALQVALDCTEDEAPRWAPSSVARELQFLVSHTVHHYAVIAAMLRPQGIEPGVDFGVAPSTLKYEQGAPCAR